MTAAEDFITRLRAQPWFADVAAQFKAKGIPGAEWASTLYTEDASLRVDAAKVEADGHVSHGLFQLKDDGVGAGLTPAQYNDPLTNARIAGETMLAALKKDAAGPNPATNAADQLRVIEKAGWNGSLNEDLDRQKNLTDVAAAITKLGDSGGDFVPIGARGPIFSSNANSSSIGDSFSNAWPSISTTLQQLATEFAIGGAFLALVAGGFAIMASGGDGGGKITPVPV